MSSLDRFLLLSRIFQTLFLQNQKLIIFAKAIHTIESITSLHMQTDEFKPKYLLISVFNRNGIFLVRDEDQVLFYSIFE